MSLVGIINQSYPSQRTAAPKWGACLLRRARGGLSIPRDLADTEGMLNATPHTACSPQELEDFLSFADAAAAAQGQRMTKIRRKVLSLLIESAEPAKAYDLLERLDGQGAAKPPTIYRALEFLQELGLAHKIESLNAYVACGHASHKHSAIFLICEACGAAEELHSSATRDALASESAAAGFQLARAMIEARGLCRSCQA